MEKKADFYEVLGVLPSVEQEAIRPIYVALIKKYHPDVHKGEVGVGETKAKLIIEAYRVLSDPVLRAEYDLQLKNQDDSHDEYQDARPKPKKAAKPTREEPSAHKEAKGSKRRLDLETLAGLINDTARKKSVSYFVISLDETKFFQAIIEGTEFVCEFGNSKIPFSSPLVKAFRARDYERNSEYETFKKRYPLKGFDVHTVTMDLFDLINAVSPNSARDVKIEIYDNKTKETLSTNGDLYNFGYFVLVLLAAAFWYMAR